MWAARGRRAAALVICTTGLAVAGCGGSSTSSSESTTSGPTTSTAAFGSSSVTDSFIVNGALYVRQLAAVSRRWQHAALTFQSNFQQAIAQRDTQLVSHVLDTFHTANSTFATRLAKLSPPAGAEREQNDLVSKVKQLGTDLDQAKAAFEQTNVTALQTINARIQSDTKALLQSAGALGQAVSLSG